MEVDSVVFNPSQLFETIRAGFAAAADAKGLDLRLETGPGAAREATGDAFRIRTPGTLFQGWVDALAERDADGRIAAFVVNGARAGGLRFLPA